MLMVHRVGLAQRRLIIGSWDLPLRALGHYTDLSRRLVESHRRLRNRFFRQVQQASRNTNSGLRVDTLLELHALLVHEHRIARLPINSEIDDSNQLFILVAYRKKFQSANDQILLTRVVVRPPFKHGRHLRRGHVHSRDVRGALRLG